MNNNIPTESSSSSSSSSSPTESADVFEGEKSMDEFLRKYCSDDSALKCKITIIGYIHDLTKKCDGFGKLIIPMDVTNTIFAYYFGFKTQICLRYFTGELQSQNHPNIIFDLNSYNQTICNPYIKYQINVPMEASLYDIWVQIQAKINIVGIKVPVFTLVGTNSFSTDDSYSSYHPDIIYFNADSAHNTRDQYDYEFYSKPNFAKLIHHKINAMKLWQATTNINSYIDISPSYMNREILCVNPILCVENATQLAQPYIVTLASSHWRELKRFSTIYIDDYTQINDDSKQYEEYKIDDIGSSNIKNVTLRKLVWKIPKGTALERFFEIARQQCNIADHKDIRLFRLYETNKYLVTFPYKFQCSEHRVLLEIGRYPRYSEVFLMVCIINNNNSISQCLPLIVDKSKSVKYLKQNIMKLFHLNPAEYKKYVCYNITTSYYRRDKCWRDSLTLGSNYINPRHGDRVGIQIGTDVIDKKISIITDTRNLNKIWDESEDTCVNSTGNPYIKQEIGIISIKGECDLKQLRKQIFDMSQFKKSNIKSHKCLLLSWLDHLYQIPLSYPMLHDGKLASQKHFNSHRSQLCVEILNEEIETIPKSCRFLHIHLAKMQQKKNQNSNEQKDNINISYWPSTHHIRIIYNEENEPATSDKITYKKLSQFICKKYNILSADLLVAMFAVTKGQWMVINDEYDKTEHGLCGKPYNIRNLNRNGQIFAIFDLLQCDIQDIDEHNIKAKIDFINENIHKCGPPPLSNKATFFYQHSNPSIRNVSDGINNSYASSDRPLQLRIDNID